MVLLWGVAHIPEDNPPEDYNHPQRIYHPLIKFHIFQEGYKNLTKSSLSIWHLLHNVKSTVKIFSNGVAFLENIDFNGATVRSKMA